MENSGGAPRGPAEGEKDAALQQARKADVERNAAQERQGPVCGGQHDPKGTACKDCCLKCPKWGLVPCVYAGQVTPLHLVTTLQKSGIVVVRGLKSVQRAALWAEQLTGARVIRQPRGPWFEDVKPKKSRAGRSDAAGMVALPPHADGSQEGVPPFLVGLYCKQQSPSPEATCVASFTKFMQTACTPEEQRWMMTHRHQWGHTFEKRGRHPVWAPICSVLNGQLVIRWSTNTLNTGESSPVGTNAKEGFIPSEMVTRLTKKLQAYVADGKNTIAACAQPGELLLIGNHQFIHFRGPLKSTSRWFVRFWLS